MSLVWALLIIGRLSFLCASNTEHRLIFNELGEKYTELLFNLYSWSQNNLREEGKQFECAISAWLLDR